MSGLKKFESSEDWRTNFKKFLFMDRKPEIVKSATITESQRYSLDIGEDLKNIIEQRKNQKTIDIKMNEEITNISNSANESALNPSNILAEFPKAEEENDNVLIWQKASDESFEAIEKMCDKTASDPNSTLFQYLHSDRKEMILAEVKKRGSHGKGLSAQNQEDSLLDDVEAPSRIWENTICDDTILQTSPVKMVGLLRPSTIIEEAPDDSVNSEISPQISFLTETKFVRSNVSSSAYETAHDSTVPTSITDSSFKNSQRQGLEVFNVDILSTTLDKYTEKQDEEAAASNNKRNSDRNEISGDLQKTFSTQNIGCIENKLRDEFDDKDDSYSLDDSIIELLSDEDDEIKDVQNIDNISYNKQPIPHNIKTEMTSKTNSLSINHDTYSINDSHESDKENWDEAKEPSEKSLQFNDTMEEVEYMLKKGMEYIAAEAAVRKSSEKIKAPVPDCNNQVSKIQPNSSMKNIKTNKHLSSSASKAKLSIYTTPARVTTQPKDHNSASKALGIGIRPFPKLDIFAKPSVHARNKEVASKQKFSHIVSPIGTYMKKTANAPLMSRRDCKNTDYFNSTAIRELENESRLYQPQFATDSKESKAMGLPKFPGLRSATVRPLPKKAYISSDLKHIVDERTPVTIPGGTKIQKYLENAMMPAVLRHDGKLKMHGGITYKLNSSTSSTSATMSKLPLKVSDTNSTLTKSTSLVPRRNNASLADLSLMSGDVSMYTIMDAQKF